MQTTISYHVYGVEWDKTGGKYYVDGKLLSTVTPDQVTQWARANRDGLTD
ncbi:family 16 glycosylhydrolase [Paraglaciecola sp. L1A13]|nr:family 16 glycosylhydrolase [Paraglaciecola sp. L1A13]